MPDWGHGLAPDRWLLVLGIIADAVVGDPVYAWHPVRLIGRMLSWLESWLRAIGVDTYGGGMILFAGLAVSSLSVLAMLMVAVGVGAPRLRWLAHALVLYTLLALGDLWHHVWRIESAVSRDDLPGARRAVAALVGRDTARMDAPACRRAAVESLSENLTDGFVSPVFWYVLAGLPGLVLFKVVSTMDSMVGYKTPRYLKFGWCGARLDDVMNYVPARLTWVAMVAVAAVLPGCSGRKAWQVGLRQHAVLLGPNSGWSEAAMAGAVQRRIVGPIWLNGVQVTNVWIGDESDPELEAAEDVRRALLVALTTSAVVAVSAAALL